MNKQTNVHDPHSISWAEIDNTHRKLVKDIQHSGYNPDILIGVTRGGLVSLTHLAYLLDMRDVRTIYISRGTGEGSNEHNSQDPINHDNRQDYTSISGKNVLLIDCAVGSGKTIDKACEILYPFNPNQIRVVITADWIGCPNRPNAEFFKKNIFYIGSQYMNWPEFPWEL